MAGYREKLEERISRIPMGEKIYGTFRGYADPSAANPAIKSIVVAIVPNYRYNVPGEFDGVYGKAYMFDSGRTRSPVFRIRKEFAAFLKASASSVRWATVMESRRRRAGQRIRRGSEPSAKITSSTQKKGRIIA